MPRTIEITGIRKENHNTHTLFLDTAIGAEPGQFVMVWIPQMDEKPFSISYSGKELGITVQERGEFSKKLLGMKEGDLLGVRGPYGNYFDIENVKNACVVAGGCGTAAVANLVEELAKNEKPAVILGARDSKNLLFEERLRKSAGELYITTDDGSKGTKGFATQMLEKLLGEESFDMVYTCGPEIMMKGVMDLCSSKKVYSQVSMERYMKCGFGVCGQCALGRYLVCKDGPVFTGEQLKDVEDFGKWARLKSGKRVGLKEYYAGKC